MDFFKKIKNKLTIFIPPKRKRVVFVFFLILALFFIITSETVHAQAWKKMIPSKATVKSVVGGYAGLMVVLWIIWKFCMWLAYLGGKFLETMLQPQLYSGLIQQQFIETGWKLLRDICNLFFLLALLFIAFCTILRIEKYHAKKTLLMLIIIALLINFSKPIAVFIFDGSQLLMNFFLTNQEISKHFSGTLTQSAELAKIITKETGGIEEHTLNSNDLDPLSYMISIIFVFIYAVALFSVAAFLLIRVVAIWVIIITSPVGFISYIIPDFKGFGSKWWDALFKYSYVGPAMAFFLYLALILAKKLDEIRAIVGKSSPKGIGIIFSPIESMQAFIPIAIIIIFLYAALLATNQFGIAFGGTINNYANRAMKWGASKIFVRAPKWAVIQTGIPGAVKQKIESVPWAKRWLTKEGRKGALEERESKLAEKMGVTRAREALRKKRVAETREKWKKEGKTVADFEQFLDSPNDVIREAAARELVRQNRVDKFSTYKKVLEAMKGRYATADEAINNKDSEIMSVVNAVKKKRPDFVADFEYDSATLRKGRSMDQVYTDVLGTLKPAEWGDVVLDKLIPNVQFRRFANSHFGTNMPAAARLEMAKNLSAKHVAYFKNPARRWI